MELIRMGLDHRAEIFSKIIAGTICTNKNSEIVDVESAMLEIMNKLRLIRDSHSSLYIIGNGGSAAVASHALVDFVNVAKINAQVLHEPSLITCMANDFGYESAYSRVLSQFIKPQDGLIVISSSGKSVNMCNAVRSVQNKVSFIFTLTGFDDDNPLRSLGDLNFWLNSYDYGFVEVGHQFILHNLSDRFGMEKNIDQPVHNTYAVE